MNLTILYSVDRIYHTWDKWECYPAGFFEVNPPKGMTEDQCLELYCNLLKNIPEFKRIMTLIISEWKNSCEHNLTNERMNRIAWVGQASLTYKYGIPAKYRGGYHLLTQEEQLKADEAALEIINIWMGKQGYEKQTLETIESKTEMDLY